jgi:hypothetical protein
MERAAGYRANARCRLRFPVFKKSWLHEQTLAIIATRLDGSQLVEHQARGAGGSSTK